MLTALVLLLATSPCEAGKANKRPKAIFSLNCATCHGPGGEGNEVVHAPAIAGQERWYLERQLRYFRDGRRGAHPADAHGATMAQTAKALDEAVLPALAAYVEELKPVVPPSTLAGDPAAGASLYAVCQACHGAGARGMALMNAPRLVAQHDWYLATQLANFRSGARGAHADDLFGQQMRAIGRSLEPDEARDVIAYIGSLAQP